MKHKHMKLFCFPYAGGNADFFNDLRNFVASTEPDIEVVALEYPGHGYRRKEDLLTNFKDLSGDMLNQIISQLNGDDYALMGYSMGSIVVSETLKRISNRKTIAAPKMIFLSAHEPKTFDLLSGMSVESQEHAIKERTVSFGAVPDSLVNNETFWRIYLPLYKADYGMISKYNFDNLDLKTDIDTVIFYSDTDTPYESMKQWRKYYYGKVDYYQFDGNHFFIKEHLEEIGNIVVKKLKEVN